MKKSAITILVISIVLLSIFALVACGNTDPQKPGDPSESVVITDPNDFIKAIETAKEFTFYQYDDIGNIIMTAGINNDDEMIMITKRNKSFVVKEGDKLVFYGYYEGVWEKNTKDESLITNLKFDIEELKYGLTGKDMGTMTKNEDGYWYSEINKSYLGFKMEDGKLVAYSIEEDKMVKFVVIELKSNIVLPEEAKSTVEA